MTFITFMRPPSALAAVVRHPPPLLHLVVIAPFHAWLGVRRQN
jgi:hypothetical protein